jgi:hypothetical protein
MLEENGVCVEDTESMMVGKPVPNFAVDMDGRSLIESLMILFGYCLHWRRNIRRAAMDTHHALLLDIG